MRKKGIELFGIKEAGLIPQVEHLFTVSSIDITSSAIVERVIFPQKLDGAVFCICEQGDLEIMINSKIYKVSVNDMFVIFPNSIFCVLSVSNDIKLYTMGVDSHFIINADIDSAIPLFLFIREHPCISLRIEDKGVLVELSEMLRNKSEREDNPYIREISESLLITLLYEISAIYLRRKTIEQCAEKRYNALFANFLNLVATNCIKERKLDFYASRMCITPKHLSLVVRTVSGKTATKWIADETIVNAKSLLQSSKMTINQISDELHFPNPSFFCQYFKKHTGVTPKSVQSNL